MRAQAAALVHSRGEHHHGAFVENDLKLKVLLADHLGDRVFMRLPSGHYHPADGDRAHSPRSDRVDEGAGRRFGEKRLLSCLGPINHRSVLDDHEVEEVEHD